MKKPTHILAALAALFIVTFSVYGQGISIRSFQGMGTNTFLETPTNDNPTFTGNVTSTNLAAWLAASNTAYQAQFSTVSSGLWRSQIWLDATNGNDSTAKANNPNKPWLSLSNACNWCSTNPFTVLRINPGFYDNGTNRIPQLSNTMVIGAGRLVCTLNVNGNFSPEPAFFRPADNFYMAEVKLLHTAANNNFFTLFGTDTIGDNGISSTNCVLYNVDMFGQADGINLSATPSSNTVTIIQSRDFSSFDTVAGGTTNDFFTFVNCLISPTISSPQNHRAVSGGSMNLRFESCELQIGNSSASGNVMVNNGNDYSIFDNCVFRDIGGFTDAHIGLKSSSSGTLIINNCVSIGTTNDYQFVSGTPATFNNFYRYDRTPLVGTGNYYGFVEQTGNYTLSSNLTFLGTITGNGSGLTNLNGANIQAATIPSTAFDSSVPPRQNYLHIVNTNNSGWIPYSTGTNDAFGSSVSTNGPPPTSGGLASVTTTNAPWYDTNTVTHASLAKDTNDVFSVLTNGTATVSLNPGNGSVNAAIGVFGGATQQGGASNTITGTLYLGQTNLAPMVYVSNPVIDGGYWTNLLGKGTLYVNYTLIDTVTGEPGLNMTNVVSTDWFRATNGFTTTMPVPGRAAFPMALNDYFYVTNQSSGGATSKVDASRFVVGQ